MNTLSFLSAISVRGPVDVRQYGIARGNFDNSRCSVGRKNPNVDFRPSILGNFPISLHGRMRSASVLQQQQDCRNCRSSCSNEVGQIGKSDGRHREFHVKTGAFDSTIGVNPVPLAWAPVGGTPDKTKQAKAVAA